MAERERYITDRNAARAGVLAARGLAFSPWRLRYAILIALYPDPPNG